MENTTEVADTVLRPVAAADILERLDEDFPIDEAVIDALPTNLTFVSAERYGVSAWTITGKIITKKHDGTNILFFLKTAYGDHGGVILNGEYESAKIINQLTPGLIPEPIGCGKYKKEEPPTYFYLSEFIHMDTNSPPDPDQLGSKLAELHRKSQTSQQASERFGFHVTTCDGSMPHNVEWKDTWPLFFAQLLRGICKIDMEVNGPWPKFERATKQVINEVVPRLLSNLTEGGQPIKPSLLHGDLWEPNLGRRLYTGELIMFDTSSYWAHNEMELGLWRADFCAVLRSSFDRYTQQYLSHFPAAEPVNEFEDRNRLYSLKATINYSAGHPGCVLRHTAYNIMCGLCEKYAPIEGIDKYDPTRDPLVTGIGIKPEFVNRS